MGRGLYTNIAFNEMLTQLLLAEKPLLYLMWIIIYFEEAMYINLD